MRHAATVLIACYAILLGIATTAQSPQQLETAADIAATYFQTGQSESAWETLKKIDADLLFAEHSNIAAVIRLMPDTNEKLENAERFRKLIDAVQSPQKKAMMLMSLLDLYIERAIVPEPLKSEFKKKRQETLEETATFLLTLPDSASKVQQLHRVRRYYQNYGQDAKSQALYADILTAIENIEDVQQQFFLYADLFRMEPQDTVEFLEKMHVIAEQANRADFWRTLFSSYASLFSTYSGSLRPNQPDAFEIFEKMQIALERMEQILKVEGFADGLRQTRYQEYHETLFPLYANIYHTHAGQPEMRQKILTAIERIENASQQFRIYETLFRADQSDSVEIFERMRQIAEETNSHWNTLLAYERRLPIQPDMVLKGHIAPIRTVQFSPDDTKIVTASRDGTARIWDAESGKLLHELRVHAHDPQGAITPSHPDLRSADFSPDGRRILTRDYGGVLQIWDVESGEQLKMFRPENYGLASFAVFSRDGKKIVTCGSGVDIWDAEYGQRLHRLESQFISSTRAAAFSPDGRTVVTADLAGTATFWETASGRAQQKKIEGHQAYLRSVAFSPDGKKIVTASADDTARIWDADSREQLHQLGESVSNQYAAFCPDGKKIITTGHRGTATIWDSVSGNELYVLDNGSDSGSITHTAFSFDGSKLLTATAGIVSIWDMESGNELQRFVAEGVRAEGTRVVGSIATAALSRDGRKVVLAGTDDVVRIWRLERVSN